MKFTAALCAVAAVAFAPLASAQINCATATNNAVLGNLTATSTIKKVGGGLCAYLSAYPWITTEFF